MSPKILAIESSCDETSASVISNGKVLNNVIASQSVHEKYGGVVPELASRAHQKNIMYVVNESLTDSGIKLNELDAIAFTKGPGLLGSLLVGVSFAKAMALALQIPLIEVNHMQGHVLSHFIGDPKPEFPFLCLTVSGGHTQILKVRDHLDVELLGETQDDAVGEAFDKSAKILGLPYPGGPLIDRLSSQGNPNAFQFSKTSMPNLDFSFSGIKTAFLYFIRDETSRDEQFIEKRKADICASLQKHLIDMLIDKLELAASLTGINQIAIAGGVAANSGLREAIQMRERSLGWSTYIPDFQYCTDNAAMIAIAAHYKYLAREFSEMSVSPLARMPIGS
ncbi:MAG: tRNA (adenosine(37)-N6)-threonylcarbamoyltransferase complex transferase subunit TsaD [Cyclobacteriaceae bacterium]